MQVESAFMTLIIV